MNDTNIYTRFKLLRNQKDWTQEHVANALGISIPAYSKIETGFTDVNFSRLIQLAKLYEMSVLQLLSEDVPSALKEIELLKNKLIERNEKLIELQEEVIKLYRKQEIMANSI